MAQDNAVLQKQLKDDNRDVADLWKEALKSYKGIVGFDLERKFDNVQGMLDYGTDQMNNFHKFRHDKGKVDRLRTLFASNLDLVEKGANQIIAAAAPTFPPASAIGTALTYMLQACRSVSADYDMVIVFFDDMNSFLARITILETRLPKYKGYQNCLMEVFTSFLTMCGFAHKYIELGRFKKWISNLFKGDDGELGGARAGMNKKLEQLQQATEFAILGNTEETLKMTAQLDENQRSHAEMLDQVGRAIDTIHENTENIRDDVAKLLKLFGGQKKEKPLEKPKANKPPSANGVRHAMPVVAKDDYEYQALKGTLLPDSCSWIFAEPEWDSWLSMEDGTRPMLAITGEPGSGKSHLAAVIHDQLAQRAKDDDTGHTCVAHFYFREQEDAFAILLCGMITAVNQIAETNGVACDKLVAQIARDDLPIDTRRWQEIAEHLLGFVFSKSSKFHLFIVFDGLDELRDWPNFKEFLTKFIVEKQLRISLVATSRPERLDDLPADAKLVRIEATKDKQRQDFKSLIWNRINSLKSLGKFSRYVKQRVADSVEESSPNLLYAEHILVRLDNLGREGTVLRALKEEWPKDLHGIYEILLAECQRRMPAAYQHVAASLLHWVAFARRALPLIEVQSLIKYLAKDEKFDLEEIHELFSKFLSVGGPAYDAELVARLQVSRTTAVQDLKQDDDDSRDQVYDDSTWPVRFRERSMRHFFTDSKSSSSPLRWGPSEANRKIFLASAELLQPPRTGINEGLQKYCAICFLGHWFGINMDQHSPEELSEVLTSLAETMSNKTGFSEMLGKAGIVYGKANSTGTHDKIREWSKLVDKAEIKARLEQSTYLWWQRVGQDPPTCRLDLAKGYLRELYEAKSSQNAVSAWERLEGVLKASGLGKLLMEQAAVNMPDQFDGGADDESDKTDEDDYDEAKASLGILNLFGNDVKPDAGGYRAVSMVLLENDHLEPAEKICREAMKLCEPADEEWYRSSCLLSDILVQRKKKKQAYKVVKAAIDELSAHEIPPSLKRTVYTTCARVQQKLGQLGPALESYNKAKDVDPDGITPGEDLVGELTVVSSKDKPEYIRILKRWSLLERITWLASNYKEENEERHALFCDIASELGEQDFIVQFYQEVVDFMDNIDAGTPIRVDLALIYFEVCCDPEKALQVLDEVFDSHVTGFMFPITGVTALWMMEKTVDTMTNIQLELFRRSRDPIYKAERIASLAGLPQRPFSLDVPRTSAGFTSGQRMGLAYMYLIMGPKVRFQEIMQSLLDDCFTGLGDSVGWNDGIYLWVLTQALGLLSRALGNDEKLRRYARIVGSALFSRLSNTADSTAAESGESSDSEEKSVTSVEKPTAKDNSEDRDASDSDSDSNETDTSSDDDELPDPPSDEGDLRSYGEVYWSCGGFCTPETEFRCWGGRSTYFYITFATGMICEECQAEYMAVERGERKFTGRYFYGIKHDYLKLPIEGWRGVRNGILTVEGMEPIAVDDFLKKIQNEVCKEVWDRLWAGEA